MLGLALNRESVLNKLLSSFLPYLPCAVSSNCSFGSLRCGFQHPHFTLHSASHFTLDTSLSLSRWHHPSAQAKNVARGPEPKLNELCWCHWDDQSGFQSMLHNNIFRFKGIFTHTVCVYIYNSYTQYVQYNV